MIPDNFQTCRRCGAPGAVLHFPGGYLCVGGCDPNPIMRITPETESDQDLLTRIKSLEEQNAKLREAVKYCEKFIHSVGRHAHLFHHSCGCWLLMKKSTDSINALELEPKEQHDA